MSSEADFHTVLAGFLLRWSTFTAKNESLRKAYYPWNAGLPKKYKTPQDFEFSLPWSIPASLIERHISMKTLKYRLRTARWNLGPSFLPFHISEISPFGARMFLCFPVTKIMSKIWTIPGKILLEHSALKYMYSSFTLYTAFTWWHKRMTKFNVFLCSLVFFQINTENTKAFPLSYFWKAPAVILAVYWAIPLINATPRKTEFVSQRRILTAENHFQALNLAKKRCISKCRWGITISFWRSSD